MIRSFDWRDFPRLHRNRNTGIWLDTGLALTRWMALVPAGALLATIAPATGIFTLVSTNGTDGTRDVVGQFAHTPGSPNARLTFITPEEEIDSPEAARLLDRLAALAGERGAHNLLAEVNERAAAYEVLRKAGFAVYARQRIWALQPAENRGNRLWRPVAENDLDPVHHLYHSLVPALVQQAEPPPWKSQNGLIYEASGELLAYLQIAAGPKGILVQPFIHPDTDHAEELLGSLFDALPNTRSRPVYLCVRSYQAWLAPFLDALGFQSGRRQAVMVKRLAVTVRESLFQTPKTGMKNPQPEISTYASPDSENGEPSLGSPG